MWKRFFYLVVGLVLVAVGLFAGLMAVDEAAKSWQSARPAVRLSAADLARKGPGGCAHVALTNFATPGQYVTLERDNVAGWSVQLPLVPLDPAGAPIDPVDIRIILTTYVQDEEELIEVVKQPQIEGLIISRGRSWNEHKQFPVELAKIYPGIDTASCWYLRPGTDTWSWVTALVIITVAAGLFGLGVRLTLACFGATASRGVGTGLLAVGACAAGLVGLYLAPRFDAVLPWEWPLKFQAAGLVNVAIALPILGLWQLFQLAPRRSKPWSVNDPDHVVETERGFNVADRHGVREFRGDQVERIAVERTTQLVSNGTVMVQRRRLTLWLATDTGEEKVRLNEDLPPDAYDPKQPLIDRLVEAVYRKALAEFRAGRELRGEGWTCDGKSILKEGASRDEAIPLADVIACERVLNQIGVWRRGEPRAVLSIKAESPNALVLARLLADHTDAGDTDPASAGHPLGRILVENNGTRAGVWILLVMAATMIGILAWCGYTWMAALVALATPFCLWQAVHSGGNFFRFHELGIHHRKGKREESFRYDQMTKLACHSLSVYQDGAYLCTHFNWKLTAEVDGQERTAKFHVILNKDFAGWHDMRDRICAEIIVKLQERLANEPYVEWVGDIWLGRGSLAYRPKGMLAQKDLSSRPMWILPDRVSSRGPIRCGAAIAKAPF
jgi:hypothetical protein